MNHGGYTEYYPQLTVNKIIIKEEQYKSNLSLVEK